MDAPPAPPSAEESTAASHQPLRLLRWRSRTQAFTERVDGLELTMLRIPSGSFRMGSSEEEMGRDADEGPQHVVKLEEFLMARTPITQAQWRVVAGWVPRPKGGEIWGRELNPEPSHFQGTEARLLEGETNTDQRPVEQVSWHDAMEFCRRLSARTGRTYTLPSEAQWEYACRAGTTTPFAFGETISPELANYRGIEAYGDGPKGEYREQTTPVGLFPANAWGLHDMHGNVWEWCLDPWQEGYAGAPVDGSSRPEATLQMKTKTLGTLEVVLRGGAWGDEPRYCRSACRFHMLPRSIDGGDGFRVVCLPSKASSRSGEEQRPDALRQATVLWVDDHSDQNRKERAELEELGIRILLARETKAALAVLSNQPVEAIISDMTRQGQPRAGLDLLEELQSIGVSIPVVFYVGVRRPELEVEARKMGAVAVINQRDELVNVVQSVLVK